MYKLIKNTLIIGLCLCCFACGNNTGNYTPKPVGYLRLTVPEHQYQTLDTILPFGFDYSQSAICEIETKDSGRYWVDIHYPTLNATLKMNYRPLRNDLRNLAIDEEKIIKFHIDKGRPDDVQVNFIDDPNSQLYGRIFELYGKHVATPFQFWASDSTDHFLKGTLYFNFAPNNDSLQPVIDFLKEDMMAMIYSFHWKNRDSIR